MALKKTMMATVVGSVAGAAAVLLKDTENRERLGRYVREVYARMTHRTANDKREDLKLKVGHPDPNDYADNKMVNEGALTSVQYYNERQQKEASS